MIYASILLTFIAAILALIARIKSKALIPSYRIDFHQVHHIFENLIWSNEKLISYLKKDVVKNGGVTGTKNDPSLGLLNALIDAETGIGNAKTRLKESKIVDATKDTRQVSVVRMYQLSSFIIIVLALIIQIINLIANASL